MNQPRNGSASYADQSRTSIDRYNADTGRLRALAEIVGTIAGTMRISGDGRPVYLLLGHKALMDGAAAGIAEILGIEAEG